MLRRLLAIAVLLCCLFVPVLSHADDLGEYILIAIREGAKPTDASLILLTRDLKFYEKNMHLLPEAIQQRVQSLRVHLASNAVQSAALEMKEAESLFGATGSWNPGRDMDVIYFGKNGDVAAAKVASAYERASENMMSALVPNDPILKMYREFRKGAPGFEIPGRLSADSMAMVTTQLPDFGYGDLEKAYRNAREILARGGSKEEIMAQFNRQVREAMARNLRAHFDTSTHPDYYRGASGQDWFRQTYLENPDKMRTFAVDPDTGSVVLKRGGINAVPEEVAKRIGFGSFQGGRLRFTKIASDYALFFSHAHGGAADNAKYAVRIFNELDFDIIKDISDEDMKLLCVSELIANKPDKAAELLAEAGLTSEDLQKGLSKILHTWTETHLLQDAERLVNELKAIGQTADDIDKLFAEARLKMNLNEMITGLDALKQAPKDVREKLIKALEKKFAGDEAGEKVIRYIMKRLDLFSDTGGMARRIIKILQELGQISDADARAALKELDAGSEITGTLGDKVKRARKEIMVLSAGGAVEFDDALDMDGLMEDWRKSQPGAQLQSSSPELKKVIRDINDPPPPPGGGSGGGMKVLGLTDEEIRFQTAFREKMARPAAMQNIRQRLSLKLSKSGVTLRQFQMKVREIMFNPAYVQLGDASMSVGVFDGVMGAAAGLYQTYDIMFNRSLSPEEESLELGNAWVTALPIVGDFAQGLITGGQAWYEGDKGKALEAGLWVSIGIMGCIPGGQLPAVIAGISLATKPLVAGAYDARQAQNLVQAWVESGDWAMAEKPRNLKGLFDRDGQVHTITYKDLLTEAGNKPYKSEMADGLLGIDVTMNDSIRDYAEKYVMPQYTALPSMRDGLKNLYPDFNDKDWKDEFTAKYKIEVRGGKGGLALFNAYYLIRTKALEQTIAQLKTWAEDEMRAAKDYDAETARLKGELQALQDELKCTTLIQHAEDSVEAYSRVVKNVWEQESLPLSKLRIYEHYVKTYRTVAGKLRRVSDLFRECAASYVPQSWHLTGFPELDVERVNTLLSGMENGRKSVVFYIEKLLGDFDQPSTKYDPSNECHKKTFDILAPLRYKVAFIENLILYYKQLADGESAWGSAYDSATQRYTRQRDSLMKQAGKSARDLAESVAFRDAFMTFVAAIPYGLASKDAELYRSTSRDYEVRLPGAQKDYEMATWTTGEAGKSLLGCLLASLKIELVLSEKEPEEGQDVTARVKLTGGTPPKENYWHWKTSGGLAPSSRAGQEITMKAASEGTVTVELLDYFDPKLAKVLVTASAAVKPKKKEDKKDDKKADGNADRDKTDPGEKDPKYVPACSYQYSAWGDCSRATKKQTRTVIGKEPAACVESGKPSLEQGCTPPPTEEEKRLAFLSCLCRACGGTMGGYFNAGDGCGGSKPCACWGVFNCWATPIPRGADLIKSCYSSAYGVKEPGSDALKNALEDVRKENRKHIKPLKVRLNHEKCPIHVQLGDIVNFYTVIDGGIPPHTVSWSGDGQAKDQQFTFANSRKPGTHAISATVNDDDGHSATVSCPVVVDAITVKIEKTSPAAETLPVGSKASFRAVVMSGSNTAGGSLKFQWQPHPEVQFGDAKKPLYETDSPNTTATYTKTGTFRMWVQVLKKMGETWQTVGESEQITMQVVNPKLELTFAPKDPWVGQEVKAKLSVKPEVKEIDFRWMPVPGNAKQSMESKDGREITFTLKDDKPAEIQVNARVPKSGEDLGEAKGTVKAKKYAVTVTGPKAMGPKPKVWKEGVGLVDVENAIAVDQIVEFAANIQPSALTGPVKYQWSVTSGPCTVSNPASREARVTASAAGGCELAVALRDKNDVPLGEARGSFSASVSRETIKKGQDKAKSVEESKKKLQDAKNKIRKGDYDGAIRNADDAAKLDPANKEAAATAGKLRKEKETIHQQIEKAKKLMDENRFADAQKELIVASNLNSYYPPVPAANKELGDRWGRYNAEVRDKVYEVRSANEKKDFGKALEIAAAWRASTKLDPYAERELKQQEDWAKQWKAQKDRQIAILKVAGEKVKAYDYAGALKSYEEGFANGQNIYNGTELEYKEAVELRGQAFQKNKRLGELTPVIQNAAESKDAYYNQNHVLEGALKTADEAIALQPTNEQLEKWREQIVARAGKTKADSERIAAGRKHLDAARNAENSFLSQDAYVRADSGRWGETIEVQMQASLGKAIENYRESLKYIPDANLEKRIRELEATLESRKKFVENVRLSKQLRAEADGVLRDARAETSFETSQEKFTRAIDLYNRSLSLYLPPDEPTLRQIVYGAGKEKISRAFRKFYTDCGALEREGRIVEALAACEKAVENRYAGMHEGEWILLGGQVQNLRSRVAHAKKMRAQGEGEERAGKIAGAVASYRESLKNVPDTALEEHVKALESKQAEANKGKATADRLWQEGAGLYSQGQYGAALDKFKESLGHGSDATRTKYVQDLEARKARAKQLRDEGYAFQQKNKVQAAIGKYRESLKYWPDRNLEDHIRLLESSAAVPPSASPAPTTTPPVSTSTQPTSPAGVETVPSRDILTSKVWQFGRSDGTVLASKMRLLPGGRIEGATHSNESQWAVVGNELLFYDSSGKAATRYNSFRQEGGRWVISGSFLLWGNITHVLREIAETASPPVVPPAVSRPTDTGGSAQSTVKAPVRTVTAEITNRSKTNAHVITEGENFGPKNKFAPGEKRKVPVTMRTDGTVVFKAGRDGTVMTTKAWRGDPNDTTRVPVVVFDDTNPFDKLTVTTGLR